MLVSRLTERVIFSFSLVVEDFAKGVLPHIMHSSSFYGRSIL